MMVSQPGVHLRPTVVAQQMSALAGVGASAHTDDDSDEDRDRADDDDYIIGGAGSNSVWAKHCSSGCMANVADSSGFRVPPLPVLNASNVTHPAVTANHAGECLVYLGMPSHGASNDQTDDAQTWNGQNFAPQVPDLDMDSLPVELQPPPPPSQSSTSCPGFWKCIVRLHKRFGHRIARQQIERGLKLYREQRHEDAVRKWRAALRRIAKQSDKFTILGYLCEVHADMGGYREMIDFAFQQLNIAHEIDCNNMRAQAYLNLSIGNGCMSMYAKAISYCDHALQHLTNERDPKTLCRVYIDLSKSNTGQSNFFKALEYLGLSMKLAREIQDSVLELQAYSELGKIFTMLKDYEKGLKYHTTAYNISKTLKPAQSRDKHERHALLNMACILRKRNRHIDAMNQCQDAMKSAINDGDIPAQAYCLFCYGNIYRDRKDTEKTLNHYEASMKLMRKLEDVQGQCQVLIGMAKTFIMMKKTRKTCDCKALQAHTIALKYAKDIGNKMLMRKCHLCLEDIYKNLGDKECQTKEEIQSRGLLNEMNLKCCFCKEELAKIPESLQVLSCSHISHARCANVKSKRKQTCPECRKSIMAKAIWMSTSSEDAGDIPMSSNTNTGIPV